MLSILSRFLIVVLLKNIVSDNTLFIFFSVFLILYSAFASLSSSFLSIQRMLFQFPILLKDRKNQINLGEYIELMIINRIYKYYEIVIQKLI